MHRILYRFRRSKITYIIVISILVVALGYLIMINFNQDDIVVLSIKEETVELEYGDSISFEASDYLNENKVNQQVIDETTVTSDAIYETYTTIDQDGAETTATYDYPAVGEYTITLTYDKTKATVELIVKDTTAPEFIDLLDEYEVSNGETLDISQFSAKDYSKITITLDDEDIDYDTAGTYMATLTASDIYDNKKTANIQVIVNIEEEEEEETTTTDSTSSHTSTSTSSHSSNSSTSNSSSSSSSSNTSSSNTSSDTQQSTTDDTSSSTTNDSTTSETEDTETNTNEETQDTNSEETNSNDENTSTDNTDETQESDTSEAEEVSEEVSE